MNQSTKARRFMLVAVSLCIVIAVTAGLLELSLQLAARAIPQVDVLLRPQGVVPFLTDAELGFKGNPRFAEHDANGLRNAAVPDTADIVAIGDSHIYGVSVAPEQSWPSILEKVTLCRTYDMSLGGYGPLQYAVLAMGSTSLSSAEHRARTSRSACSVKRISKDPFPGLRRDRRIRETAGST
jgi:hypothetical protein